MTVKIRKKNIRMRGSQTHGWGAKKKHRGAGNRGGRGMAGTGKRADAKKPSIWKDKNYFGKYGFKSKKKPINVITIRDLDHHLKEWVNQNKIKKENDLFIIDLSKLNYQKLLATGKINYAVKLSVKYATDKAVEKIKNSGGSVTLLNDNDKKKIHSKN